MPVQQTPTRKAILEGPHGPAAWIIPFLSLESFRENWRSALLPEDPKKPNNSMRAGGPLSKYQDYWQADALSPSVKRTHIFLEITSPWTNPDVLRRVWNEAETYTCFLNAVKATNAALRGLPAAIATAKLRLAGIHRRNNSAAIQECSTALNRLSSAAECLAGEYWTHALTTPTEPAIFEHVHLPSVLRSEKNLDSWYQIRVGAILRRFDPWITRLDISRLVLLSYVCAELVEERGDHLFIVGGTKGRELRVSAIYEKLRDAGLG